MRAPSRSRVFIDADSDLGTGFPISNSAIGSDMFVEGYTLYRHAADDTVTTIQAIPFAPQKAIRDAELSIPLARIFAIAPGTQTHSPRAF